MFTTINRIEREGSDIRTQTNGVSEQNAKHQLIALANDVSNYVITIEAEIDKNMLNAANVLAEVDALTNGNMSLAEMERIRKLTGMSDLYLGGTDGVFTLTTEPAGMGESLFNIWEGYRMLVTGESDYMPSSMKMKFETGEIFKFTSIPRRNGRGVLESALNADSIERNLQSFVQSDSSINSINLFDYTLLTLTHNQSPGKTAFYTKGAVAASNTSEIAALFNDASKISLSMDQKEARLYYPVIVDGQVRYVMFINFDTTQYFTAANVMKDSLVTLIRDTTHLNIVSLSAVFAALLLFTVLIATMISRLLKPLSFFNSLLVSFADGNFSITVPEKLVKQKDETGEMSVSFLNTASKIKKLVIVIKDKTATLSNTGKELAINTIETATAINEITVNIKNIAEQVQDQSGSVIETSSGMKRIMLSIDKLNEHIKVQSDAVETSSSAIEEMLANIRSVAETLNRNSSNVVVLAETSEVGRRDLETVSADIQEIARESEGILEINGVMESIASQTNLLSMNAAIEAAHAGEVGKGFAVVADEIRKLSESSSEQSKTIATVLKKIKASIDSITQSTAVVLTRFSEIEQAIGTVSEQEADIRSAMEEQEVGSRSILEAVSKLNDVTGRVKNESEGMITEGKEVIRQSNHLKQITDEITSNMEKIAGSTEQINVAVTRVNEISSENKTNIDAFGKAVSTFKVG
jgi:methyl-accepting chemotaxis protein